MMEQRVCELQEREKYGQKPMVAQEPFVNISINPRGPWVPCGTLENCEKEPRTHMKAVWTSMPFFNRVPIPV